MEKIKKDLKSYSILILAFCLITLVRNVVELCTFGLPQVAVSGEMTESTLRALGIASVVLSFVLLLPQAFIGVVGVKIANGANIKCKAHIVLAIVLAVICVSAVICGVIDLFSVFNVGNMLGVLDCAVDVLLYVCYYLCALKIITK